MTETHGSKHQTWQLEQEAGNSHFEPHAQSRESETEEAQDF